MKQFFIFSLSLFLFGVLGCRENVDPPEHAYQIDIIQPEDDHAHLGETIQIQINFEEKNQGRIHHVSVRIYNKDDHTEVYSQPDNKDVDVDGLYEFQGEFTFDVEKYTYWILEAKVWAHEDGEDEVIKTMEFFVH